MATTGNKNINAKLASFDRAKKWVQELQAQGNPNMVMALAGNKADLLDAKKVTSEQRGYLERNQHRIQLAWFLWIDPPQRKQPAHLAALRIPRAQDRPICSFGRFGLVADRFRLVFGLPTELKSRPIGLVWARFLVGSVDFVGFSPIWSISFSLCCLLHQDLKESERELLGLFSVLVGAGLVEK
ncbi:hypothetical protein ACFE04_015806 [Oxalis oulophora]